MPCDVRSGVVFATAGFVEDVLVMHGHVFLSREGGGIVSVEYQGYPRRRRDDHADGSPVPQGPPVGWAWPNLWAFLTAPIWEDRSARVTGTVTLFSEGGRLKACFSDRDAGEVGFTSLDATEPILDQLEAALTDETIDWRRPAKGRAK